MFELDTIICGDNAVVKRYRTIVADPPWPYKAPGQFGNTLEHRPNHDKTIARFGSGSKQRYGAMSIDDLKRLLPSEVIDDNAHLYLWTTNSFLREAHDVAEAWGFRPSTCLTWGKVKPDGTPSMKMGYYFRGATEHCLFCVRGKLRLAVAARPTLYLSRRLPHSVKPHVLGCFKECGTRLVVVTIPVDAFARFSRRLSRNGANYARVRRELEYVLFVSTNNEAILACGVEVSLQRDSELFTEMVMQIQDSNSGNPVSTSRKWSLPSKEHSGWDLIAVGPTPEQVRHAAKVAAMAVNHPKEKHQSFYKGNSDNTPSMECANDREYEALLDSRRVSRMRWNGILGTR